MNSICCQTETNLEIIVIDDGSSDGSWDRMKLQAANDKRIKFFHQENRGVSFARNYGLKMSNGDYISFVDADDYIEKDYISELYKADISLCMFVNETEQGKRDV